MSIGSSYYCHHCQSNTSVFRVPLLVCGTCQSPFVQEVDASRSSDTSERVHGNVSGSQRSTDNHIASDAVSDDGDEDYEDIEDDSDLEMHSWRRQREYSEGVEENSESEAQPWQQYYSEPDPGEEDHFLPWSRYYRSDVERSVEAAHQQSYRPNPMDNYDIDQYYDAVYDYNSRLPMDEVDRMNRTVHHHHHYHDYAYGTTTSMHEVFEQLISMFYGVTSESGETENPWNALLRDLLQTRDGSVQRVAATAGQIEKLEKRTLKEGDADIEVECIICQEPYGSQTEIMKMPCKHEYHGKCIRQWLGISTTCPMCRSSLPTDESSTDIPHPHPQSQLQPEENPFSSTFDFETPLRGRTLVDICVENPHMLPSSHNLYDDIDENHDDDASAEVQDTSMPRAGQATFGFCPHGYSPIHSRVQATEPRNQTMHRTNPMDELD